MTSLVRCVALGAAVALLSGGVWARDAVLFVCAHPDDLGGCSGTAMRLAERFDVHVLDYTHGERGLGEEGYRDGSVRKLRTQEETEACAIAGVTLHWFDEIDGEAGASIDAAHRLAKVFKALNPRALVLHWPIDTHTDHVMSAAAALKAVELAGMSPEVYFQEQPHQTRSFRPTRYVDISSVKARKDRLIMCYRCQWPEAMRVRKTEDARFRGREAGFEFAEAFGEMRGTVPSGKGIFDEIAGVR